MGTKTLVGCSVTPLVLSGVVLACLVWGAGAYVSLTREDVRLERSWTQMENAWLHRRILIPDLFELAYDTGSLDDDTHARLLGACDRAAAFTLTPELLDDEPRLQQFLEAQTVVERAVSELLEEHRDVLKSRSPEVFERLSEQLDTTRDRLEQGRSEFNSAVESYNRSLGEFPRRLIAAVFDFRKRNPCEPFVKTGGPAPAEHSP